MGEQISFPRCSWLTSGALELELELELELSQFDGHFFHGVERVSTCESGLQFIAI